MNRLRILVADDHVLRVGSSNLNNRSMGLDTECDVTIDARAPDVDPDREVRTVPGAAATFDVTLLLALAGLAAVACVFSA